MFDWIGMIFGYVLNFFYYITGNYGIAIVIFTIVTRLLMFPLTISQQKNSLKMARVSPKQKELQKKYANNKEKYNEEVQNLYAKEGISSFSGCLPMLIQFPILLGLYSAIRQPLTHVFRVSQETVNQIIEIMGIGSKDNYAQITIMKNLVEKGKGEFIAPLNGLEDGLFDKLSGYANSFDLGINLLPVPVNEIKLGLWFPIILVPIFVFLAQFISFWVTQRMNKNQMQTGGCNPMVMGVFFSLFSFYLSYSVPAALGFYWICSSLIAPAQTYVVNRFYSAGTLNARSEAQRIASLKLEEEKVINSVGSAEFLPNYEYQPLPEGKKNGKKKK